jgi:hypothetical protein
VFSHDCQNNSMILSPSVPDRATYRSYIVARFVVRHCNTGVCRCTCVRLEV